MKYAVYVEGLAEMLFVADLLSKYSNYNPSEVGFSCLSLNADDVQKVSYPIQGDMSSRNYYQIVNVNNDSRVISKLKHDIPNLVAEGYEVIMGLKDVFGADYDSFCANQVIDDSLIQQMHHIQSAQLQICDANPKLHFAIMEYEAWMMALLPNFIVSKGGDIDNVFHNSGVNPIDDFEKTVFHPASKVEDIWREVGCHYGKHEKDYFSFLGSLSKDDYEALRLSGRCASFAKFVESLIFGGQPSLP